MWWEWELEPSSHLLKRMVDRGFTEVDLRRMLEHAYEYSRDIAEGRWVVSARHETRKWEVILEPDFELEVLLVVTAYPVE